MLDRGKVAFVESALVLALMGILAGAIGGLAVGFATSPKTATLRPPHTSKNIRCWIISLTSNPTLRPPAHSPMRY